MEMRVEEYVARGMSEEDARRAVTARFGDADAARAECVALGQVRETHARRANFLDELRSDVRFALRSLGRSPGWTSVALLTIALGVGATTTVFSVADALLVRPSPYRDASRVFVIRREFTIDGHTAFASMPISAVREWRSSARTIEGVAPFSRYAGQLGSGSSAVTVRAALIDTGFLAFAGAHPLIGRNFTADEMTPGGPGAVLLGENFWRREYGASRDAIGKVVQIGERSSTIIGVVPASLSIPDFRAERADVLMPLSTSPNTRIPGMLVRLKPGVSADAATADIDAIFKRSVVEPRVMPMPMRLHVTRPQDGLEIRQALLMLSGAVALLLLVACTNVAHLLLARGVARQRELAVRHALGAGRGRLIRQLVTECLVLAGIGGTLAVFVGWAGLHVLAAARPANVVALSYVSTDRGILSITSVLAIVCGLAIGLLSSLRSAHSDLGATLRAGTSSTPITGRRLRGSLVVGEVAFSATLLVGALLLIHAVFDLQRTPLGFDARGMYAASFSLSDDEAPAARASFAMMLRERAAHLPGVERVTLAAAAPSGLGMRFVMAFETPERPASGDASGSTALNFVAPDYFAMMGIPLVAGRTFDEGSLTRGEVIVSKTVAEQLWPSGNAVGKRFRNAVSRPGQPIEPWQTVIGVVPDVVQSLIEDTAQPELYRPLEAAGTMAGLALIVRFREDAPATPLGDLVTSLRPNRAGTVLHNVREEIDQSMAEPRFTMLVLVIFAALGVVLAAIGLFGVISYSVSQRTREIGVRMTLGATRSSIARLVVGDGIRLAVLGIGVGLLGAIAATRLIQGLLYRVSPLDPFSFGLGALLLLVVSVAACVIPMLRATGVDPAIAVRCE